MQKLCEGFFEESGFPGEGFNYPTSCWHRSMFFREMTALPLHVVASPLASTTWRILVVMVNVFFEKKLMFFTW